MKIDLNVGCKMYQLVEELYPICRSITGDGVRKTLEIVKKHIPLMTHEVKTGTQVYDWEIPKEWNISEAYIIGPKGDKIVDFKDNNLHVLNYSIPINKKLSLNELKKNLYTLPDYPDWIPYRTTYYEEKWGFCLSYNMLQKMEEGSYHAVIDSILINGHLTYGEYFIKGETNEEVLFSCHVCHPSLCNDNLSGIALMVYLAQVLEKQKLKYSYRFLFIPGTIGSITWLFENKTIVPNIKCGMVVVCVGDTGPFTYKRSRQGDTMLDQAALNALDSSGMPYKVIDFHPYGYDERQFCSPGFNLAVGSLSRSTHGQYAEYHTSADDLDFVKPHSMAESLQTYASIIDIIENNKTFINLKPMCEPQLGKRGLYRGIGGNQLNEKSYHMALLWVLNFSDGQHSLLDISDRSGVNFCTLRQAAEALLSVDLIAEAS